MVSLSKVYKPVYVIVRGRGVDGQPIKLESWEVCKEYVNGFPGAEYKKCANDAEANRFIEHQMAIRAGISSSTSSTPYIARTPPREGVGVHNRTVVYTDGSSIPGVGAGYGIVMLQNGEKMECCGPVPQFGVQERSQSSSEGLSTSSSRSSEGVSGSSSRSSEGVSGSVSESSLENVLGSLRIPTNNQAELYAIAVAIENCKGPLLIRTDSEYSINCLTKWYVTWEVNGWKNAKGEQVANCEFIKYLLKKIEKRDVQFEHVRGHYGDVDNERCDELAKMGARGIALNIE